MATKDRAEGLLLDQLHPSFRIAPPSQTITLGRFLRDDREILLLVNVGQKPYRGHLAGQTKGRWAAMDPASATVQHRQPDDSGRLSLDLAPREPVLLVKESTKGK
jgi:hypothetical protein